MSFSIIVHPSIIDILVADMFFHPDDYGGVTQKAALKLFTQKEDHYEVTIANPTQFHLVVAHIARGDFFSTM